MNRAQVLRQSLAWPTDHIDRLPRVTKWRARPSASMPASSVTDALQTLARAPRGSTASSLESSATFFAFVSCFCVTTSPRFVAASRSACVSTGWDAATPAAALPTLAAVLASCSPIVSCAGGMSTAGPGGAAA